MEKNTSDKETAADRLRKFSSGTSDWVKETEWRIKNEKWLDYSASIAIKILSTLRKRNISKEFLSKKCKIRESKINKIVRGSYNLSIKDISKIENALNIKLLDITYND
jgi:ribosome-binding protein aMBF1 (putative translation factor)